MKSLLVAITCPCLVLGTLAGAWLNNPRVVWGLWAYAVAMLIWLDVTLVRLYRQKRKHELWRRMVRQPHVN